MKKIYLSDFDSIRPEFEGTQAESIQILSEIRLKLNPALNRPEVEARIQKYGNANSQIKTRGTEIPDFTGERSFLFHEDGTIANLSERMEFFKAKANKVFAQWYNPEKYHGPDARKKPNHLVHVTCTGYIAPNAAHSVASQWAEGSDSATPHSATVTNAYHMGCYASLPALRIARGLCLSSENSIQVDIAHNELCTLHFDPTTLTPEQIVVQSLFADGHMKYSLTDAIPQRGFKDCFEICALDERTLSDSLDLMTWVPGTSQFNMTLSREVPMRVAPVLQSFVRGLLEQAKIEKGTPVYFAIHPGGPKIIDGVEMLLDLSRDRTIESHEILETCGNMSSATLPHIWDRILKNKNRENNAAVVSLGFGPGLTMSGSVFRICRS